MNITEQTQRLADKGLSLSVRTRGICPWAAITLTLQDADGYGVSLVVSKTEMELTRIDLVGLRLDHALQDYF